jgi:hypothetical protein
MRAKRPPTLQAPVGIERQEDDQVEVSGEGIAAAISDPERIQAFRGRNRRCNQFKPFRLTENRGSTGCR